MNEAWSFYLRHRSAILLPWFAFLAANGIWRGSMLIAVWGALAAGCHLEVLMQGNMKIQAKARGGRRRE